MFAKLMSAESLQIGALVLGVVVALYVLMMYFGKEGYMDIVAEIERSENIAKDKFEHQDVSQTSLEVNRAEYEGLVEEAGVRALEASDPEDLLPRSSEADEWARDNPSTPGSIHDGNMLEAGFHYGVDTQGHTKIRSRDIRSLPPVPKDEDVGPWLNSSFRPDPYRKQFEIGESHEVDFQPMAAE